MSDKVQGSDHGRVGAVDEFDDRVHLLLQSVSVPAGLQDRLMACLANEATDNEASPASEFVADDLLSDSLAAVHAETGVLDPLDSTNSQKPTLGETERDGKRTWLSRRGMGSVIALAGALLAVAIVGWSLIGNSFTRQQLVDFCMTELETSNGESEVWQNPTSMPGVWSLLRFSQPRDFGERVLRGRPFSDVCNAWSVADDAGRVYIFEFVDAGEIENLTGQLAMIHQSGGWSMAAYQVDGQITVIATRGNLSNYLRRAA